jgi:putative ABC transport system permease protein
MRRVALRGMLARKLRLALTALAIVLGITFVSGTLVLGDTLDRTFDDLIGNVYRHVSFEIRGKAVFAKSTVGGVDSTANRREVPASIAAAVRRVPGVAFAIGSVEGYAQFVRNGSALGNGGGAALGFSFDPNPKLSALRLVAGKAPTTAHEVVMDEATASKHHFHVGQSVRVLLSSGPPRSFTISGIVTFGSAKTLAGTTLAGFYLPTAQRLFDSRGRYDTINVLAKPGADNVALQRDIAKLLPPDVQVVSGQTVASELSSTVNNELSFISTALLVFAFIALFVGGFTIFNTFSITVGQRTRELALLRVVGASRQQVFRSVLAEAALTGLLASLVGLGLGVLAALGLKALLASFGITLPSAPLVFEARTAIVAILVGVGVTVVSAIGPARRALRIAPVAALVEQVEDQPDSLRRRLIAGASVGAVGLVLLLAGLNGPAIALVGLGTLAVLVAAGMLAPTVARPLAGLLGRPLAAFSIAGRLGRENSMRSPRRTSQTAAALMVGLALVSTIAVLGASLSRSATDNVDSAISADYIVGGSGIVSKSVAPAIARLPGVRAVATVYDGQFELDGSVSTLAAISADAAHATLTLSMTSGRAAPALAAGELLVDTTSARADELKVGSTVHVTFAATGPTTMRVGGIYKPNSLVGSYVTGAGFFATHFSNAVAVGLLVRTDRGPTSQFTHSLKRRLAGYANLSIKTRAQFEHDTQKQLNELLGLVYVLLALAIAIALIGIVNTLMLSVFERTREIGLLRAVGMKRRQVRAMIRAEALIIALLGATLGVAIGIALGVALVDSLRQQGVDAIVVPLGSVLVFLVIAALLGLLAATWPGRRAARLDVLRAIATE